MARWTALLAALCLFAGLEATYRSGSAPWGNKTLRYQYQAQVVTGIKELSNNVAGIGIRAQLLLETNGDRIVLKLENVQLGQTKQDKLESWQTFRVPMSYEGLNQESRVLALPITATFVDGQIHEVQPNHEDQTWSINIKRSILTLLNLKLRNQPQYGQEQEQEQQQDKPYTYSTHEDGIGGFCHTFYVVEKAPRMTETQHLQNAMRVTKTRDYKNCQSRPKIMIASHPVVQCSECDSENVQLLNNGETVNYEVIGHPSRYVIKEISSDGYTTFAPYTSKADELTTMHRITIKLEDSNKQEILQEFAQQQVPQKSVFDHEWRQDQEWDRATIQSRSRRSVIGGFKKVSSAPKNPLFRMWRPENYGEQQQYNEQDSYYGNQMSYDNQDVYGRHYSNQKSYGSEGERLDNEFRGQRQHQYKPNKMYGGEEDIVNQRWNQQQQYDQEEPRYYGQNYYGQQKYGQNKYYGQDKYSYGQQYYQQQGQEYSGQSSKYDQKQSARHYLNQQAKSSIQFQFPEFQMQEMSEQDLKKPNPKLFFHHQQQQINIELHQIEAQLMQLVQGVASHNEEAFTDAPLQYLTLVRQFRHLHYDQIMQLVEKMMQQEQERDQEEGRIMNKEIIAKRLLTDIIAASGTNPCILAIKTMIERQLIKGNTASQAVQAIPTYVIQPSGKLIRHLMELVETRQVREDRQLYKTLLMTIGELIGMVDGPRSHITPRFVNRKEQTTQFVEELIRKLQTAEKEDVKAALLQALGQTAQYEIIPVLAHYAQDKQIPTFLRVKAIYSLNRVANHVHKQIWNVLRPIFRDTTDQTEVRIAAFDILLSNSDPNTFLERVAAMTWYEPDTQLVSYVYSSLKSLAEVKTPCYKDMTQYAKIALDVAKPVEGIHKSKSIMLTKFAEQFGLGGNLHIAYIQGRHSVIPRVMHVRIGKILANHWFQPFQATVHTQGIQTLLNKIMGPDAWFNKNQQEQEYETLFEQEEGRQYEQDEDIELKHRRQEPVFLSMYMNLFGTQNRQFQLDQETLKKIVSEYGQHQSGTHFLLRALQSGCQMHLLSATNVMDVIYQLPNPTGLPLLLQIDAPTVIDIKTVIKAKEQGSEGIEADLQIVPRVSTKLIARMGVYAPQLRKFLGAGIKVAGQVALPFTAEMEIKQENKLMLVLKPSSKMVPQVVPHVKYQVLPFTFDHRVEEIIKSPVVNVIPIQKRHMIKSFEHDLSHLALGAPLVYVGEYEMPNGAQRKGRDYEDKLHTKTVGGLLEHVGFFWATPVATYRHYELRMRKGQQQENQKLILTVDLKTNPVTEEFLSVRTDKPQQKLMAGLWTFVSGWSKVPTECDNENTKHYSQYEQQEGEEPRTWRNYLSQWAKHGFYHQKEQQEREMESQLEREDEQSEQQTYNYRTKSGRQQYAQQQHGRILTNTPAKIHKYPVSSLGSELKLKTQVICQGQETLNGELVIIKESPQHFKTNFKLTLHQQITHQSEKTQVCGTIQTTYPKVPCHIESLFDPQSYGKIQSKIQINWGKQECQTDNFLQIQAVADKSQKQLEKEERADTWYFRQCQKDHRDGTVFSRACHLAIDDLSSLNRISMQIRHSKLTKQARNFIHQVDALIKDTYHPQPLTRPQLEDDNELVELVAEVEEGHPLFNVWLQKPQNKILYRNVHSQLLSALTLPFPTRYSQTQQFFTKLTNGQTCPKCHINGNVIKTFDDNIMKVQFTPCKYVLAKDCSGKDLFTVYARPTQGQQQKHVEVRLLNHVIVFPADVTQNPHVIVDGQKYQVEKHEIVVVKTEGQERQAIALVKFDGAKIVLKAPHHGLQVVTDGKHIKVEVSNMWRGRVCGICGEMIKNKKSQLMGPNKCIQPNPQALVESYMVRGEQCQKMEQHQKQPICVQEGEHKSHVYNPFQQYFTKHYQGRQYVHLQQNYGPYYGQQSFYGRHQEGQQFYGRQHQQEGQQYYGRHQQEGQFYGRQEGQYYGQQHQQEGQQFYGNLFGKHNYGQYGREYQTYGKNQQFNGKKHGLKEQTLVKEIELEGEQKTCFSLHPVQKCKTGYRPVVQEERQVRFHCLPAHQQEKARELAQQARSGQVLYQMADKTVSTTKMVSVNKTCVVAA